MHEWGTKYRQTDRQTNSLTPHTGVCGFFLSVKFATSLLTTLAGELNKNCKMGKSFPEGDRLIFFRYFNR